RPPRAGGGEERAAVAEPARVRRVEPPLDVGEQRPRTRPVRVGDADHLVPAAGAELDVLVRGVLSLDGAGVGAGRELQRPEERDDVARHDARAEELETGADGGVSEALRRVVVDAFGIEVALPGEVRNLGLHHEVVDGRVLRAQEDTILPLALGAVTGAGLLLEDAIFQHEPEAAVARAIEPEGRGGWIAAAERTRKSGIDGEDCKRDERDETEERRAHWQSLRKSEEERNGDSLDDGKNGLAVVRRVAEASPLRSRVNQGGPVPVSPPD